MAWERHLAMQLPRLPLSLVPTRAHTRELQKCTGIYSKEPSAEDKRFELLKGFPLHAFQACALGRYANPPCRFWAAGSKILGRYAYSDPPHGDTVLNSPRAGRQQG